MSVLTLRTRHSVYFIYILTLYIYIFESVNTQIALSHFNIKLCMSESLVILVVVTLLIQGGTLSGSF